MEVKVCLSVPKLHPSVTLVLGYIVEDKFCPKLHAELTGEGSVCLGADLGSTEVTARQKTLLGFRCIFPGYAAPICCTRLRKLQDFRPASFKPLAVFKH